MNVDSYCVLLMKDLFRQTKYYTLRKSNRLGELKQKIQIELDIQIVALSVCF